MPKTFSIVKFHNELEALLLTSTAETRKKWAQAIIDNNVSLIELSSLLKRDKKIAIRFSWLLSEVGECEPEYLFKSMPKLFELRKEIDQFDFTQSFASYWRITGIPEENEAVAIDLLFGWIRNNTINSTIKSRAIFTLDKLTLKYPEIKHEFIQTINTVIDAHSKDFRKRVEKIITKHEG